VISQSLDTPLHLHGGWERPIIRRIWAVDQGEQGNFLAPSYHVPRRFIRKGAKPAPATHIIWAFRLERAYRCSDLRGEILQLVWNGELSWIEEREIQSEERPVTADQPGESQKFMTGPKTYPRRTGTLGLNWNHAG
jgi:hypothetical protein